MIEGRFIKDGHYTELVANGEDIVNTDKVVELKAWTMMPKRKKRRPEWINMAILVSVLAPQVFTLMFASVLLNQSETLYLSLAAATEVWTFIVVYANCKK